MTLLKLKQLAGPSGADNQGSAIVFDNGQAKWTHTNTGALLLPGGTTEERPTGLSGHIRVNKDTGKIEAYEGGSWKNMIAEAELLRRFSFRINFNSSQQPASAEQVPQGWTINNFSANSFTITHNVGRLPFLFTTQGWSGTRYQARPMTGTFYFDYDPASPETVIFKGVGSSVSGTTANGHSFFWLMF